MKKVSIIVPIYKSECFIEKLVNSVQNQTYDNYELILVDDGSPDNSGKICDELAKKNNKIKVIHKKNGGTCEARNTGLQIASGDYIMFADGDDWFAKDCLEYLVTILEKNNADMSMSDCVFTTRNLEQNKSDFVRVMTPEEATAFILYAKTPIGPWNKLYKREIVYNNNLTFSVPWFGEGLYFSTMAAQYSKKVVVGHKKVYVYRMNNVNSGTTVGKVQHGLNALENIKFIKDNLVLKNREVDYAADWHIWNNNYNLVLYVIGADAKKEYCDKYKESIRYIRKNCFKVLLHSDLSIKKKIIMFLQTISPVISSRYIIWRRRKLLLKDTTE